MRTSLFIIEDFINQKIDWIEKHQRKIQEKTTKKILTDSEIKIQIETLRLYIIPRVYEFWE
jgi:predicted metal-dependent hydrolase